MSDIGLSPFIMQSSESVIMVCFNASLLKYGGDIAVGAMTILSSAMQFSMLPLQGLGQGAQPISSYNFGARNVSRVKETFYLLLKVSLAYSFLLWGLVMLFPQGFAMIFSSDAELVSYTAMGDSYLYGRNVYFWYPDGVPADIYFHRKCKSVYSGSSNEEIYIASAPDFPDAASGIRSGDRSVSGRTGG